MVTLFTELSLSAADTSDGFAATPATATIAAASAARPTGVPSILTKDQTPVPRKSLPLATVITESMALLRVQKKTMLGGAAPVRGATAAVWRRGAAPTTKAEEGATAASRSSSARMYLTCGVFGRAVSMLGVPR